MNTDDGKTTDANQLRRGPRIRIQFGIKAMLLIVLLAAISIPIAQDMHRRYVLYQEGQEYVSIQATKDAFVNRQEQLRERLRKKSKQKLRSLSVTGSRPIPDNFVVLVRRGGTFGCFIPKNQHKAAESLEYDWYYRTDGRATFSKNDPNVQYGSTASAAYTPTSGEPVEVSFGPFSMEWSGNGPGWGYVYYSRKVQPANEQTGICVTGFKTVEYLDGQAAKWIYKAGTQDVGVTGNVDVSLK